MTPNNLFRPNLLKNADSVGVWLILPNKKLLGSILFRNPHESYFGDFFLTPTTRDICNSNSILDQFYNQSTYVFSSFCGKREDYQTIEEAALLNIFEKSGYMVDLIYLSEKIKIAPFTWVQQRIDSVNCIEIGDETTYDPRKYYQAIIYFVYYDTIPNKLNAEACFESAQKIYLLKDNPHNQVIKKKIKSMYFMEINIINIINQIINGILPLFDFNTLRKFKLTSEYCNKTQNVEIDLIPLDLFIVQIIRSSAISMRYIGINGGHLILKIIESIMS